MLYQNSCILFNIWTTMSIWCKTEKRCKRILYHHFIIGVSALTGSPCMASRDQLWYVMTSSVNHGDAFIVSGTCTSNGRTMIQPLNINPFFRYMISFRTFWSTHVHVYKLKIAREIPSCARRSLPSVLMGWMQISYGGCFGGDKRWM